MKAIYKLNFVVAILLAGNAMAAGHSQQVNLLEQRIQLLESALQPDNPTTLVNMFAQAVEKRNGAVQYMLFCAPLQKKYLASMQNMNWVSGTSSPSVTSYKIKQLSDEQYTIDFSLSLQGKVVDTRQDKLTVKTETMDEQMHYCITAYSSK